jgi:hypothetical protein
MTIYAGLGIVLPVLGLGDLIVKRNLAADEYIHPGSGAVN